MRHENCTPLKMRLSKPEMPPRTSWWLNQPRDGFTRTAVKEVVSDDLARPVYKWRDNND
jgi:hypothetical protein